MKIRTALKALSLIFTLLLVVVVAPLGYLMLSDANDFKPQLQKLALEQGVQLDIAGDLNWQIYPDIELEISDVNIKSEKDSLGLNATLGMAKLQVALRPLFSGELKVRGVEISNSRLSIIELAETSDVETEDLEKITGQAGTAIESERENLQKSPDSGNSAADSAQSISFQKLSFQKLHLEYKPIDGVATALSIDNLNIEQLNLAGGQFPISLNLAYQGGQQSVKLSTDALLSIDLDKQIYTLSTEQLTLDLAGEQSFVINAKMGAAINLISNQWNVALTQAHLEDLEVKANASGSVEPLTALGQLEFDGGSQFANGLAGQKLLKTLSVRADFDYSPARLFLNDVSAKFDESNLESSVEYYLSGDSRSELRLSLDKINLDKYLAIDSENQNANPKSSGEENPLMFLETISATDVFLNIGELSSNGQKLADIKVEVAIDHSEANVQLTNATWAGGVIKGSVLVRATELPQLVISGLTADQVNLAPLTLNESGKPLLQGVAELSFDGQLVSLFAEGSVLKGLNGSGQLDVKDLQLADTNIEQSICASAKQLGATAAPTEQWASGTQFDQLSSPYDISKGLLSLEKIGTGFGNIKLGGNGELDLDSMNFGAKLSLRIEGERTSEQGCSINKYLRNTSLPLSCEGNLAEGGETSCGLDSLVVGKLLKGQLKNELGRQLGRLLGGNKDEADAASEGSNGQTEQDSSEQVNDAVKGLLEGLFQ